MSHFLTCESGIRPAAHHPCSLCDSRAAKLIATKDRDGRPLPTVLCLNCGLVRTDPMPSAAELADYYAHRYRRSYKGAWQPEPKRVYRAARVAADRWRRLKPHLLASRRVLDVGASSGEFVYLLQTCGKQAEGIEPNENYARWARDQLGLPVRTLDWHRAVFPERNFEAITLFHVLEHLANPREALTRLAGWLDHDGVLVVEVPNVESPVGSPKRRFHYAHLHNFNPASLRETGRCAGLTVRHEEISPDGGNLTVVFARPAVIQPGVSPGLPGNAERVLQALQARGNLSYALAGSTWRRLAAKLARSYGEHRALRRWHGPRAFLEAVVIESDFQLGAAKLRDSTT